MLPSAFVGMISLALRTATDRGESFWRRRARLEVNRLDGNGTAFMPPV